MFVSESEIKEHLIKEASSSQISRQCPKLNFVIPKLNNWAIQYDKEKIYIRGTVCHHPKYKQEARIKTSNIMSFHKIDGRNIISTRNSMYELGDPAIQLQGEQENSYKNLQQKVKAVHAESNPYPPDPADLTQLTNTNSHKPKSN